MQAPNYSYFDVEFYFPYDPKHPPESFPSREWPMLKYLSIGFTLVPIYLFLVKIIFPWYMKNRKPYDLTFTMQVYNFVQIIFSIAITYLSKDGFSALLSGKIQYNYIYKNPDWISSGFFWYGTAKVTEILDTLFMCLRKKNSQISFLHLFHHSVMIIATTATGKYSPNDFVLGICALNSAVHIVMYSYYFLASLGPSIQKYLWWKKYLTLLQILQFLIIIIGAAIIGLEQKKGFAVFVIAIAGLLTLLFINFAYQQYAKMNRHRDSDAVKKSS